MVPDDFVRQARIDDGTLGATGGYRPSASDVWLVRRRRCRLSKTRKMLARNRVLFRRRQSLSSTERFVEKLGHI